MFTIISNVSYGPNITWSAALDIICYHHSLVLIPKLSVVHFQKDPIYRCPQHKRHTHLLLNLLLLYVLTTDERELLSKLQALA